MRRVSWMLAAIVAAILMSTDTTPSFAQGGGYWQPQHVATNNSNDELVRRLDAYEAELRQLRTQIGSGQLISNSTFAEGKDGAVGNGLKEIPINSKVTHKFRGRVYLDEVWREKTTAYVGGPVLAPEAGEYGFDTVRIGVQGKVWENMKYSLEVEFEGNEVDYKDIYMELTDLAILNQLKIGFHKVPYGLEELVSSRFDSFMEQTPATTAFVPSRRWAYMSYLNPLACRDFQLAWGIFHQNSSDSPLGNQGTIEEGNGEISFATRAAWLPFYDEPSGGRYLTHLAGSYMYRNTAESIFGFSDAPQLGTEGDYLRAILNTDTAIGDAWHQFGGEFAWMNGPSYVQTEVFAALLKQSVTYTGFYAELGYFLTGEHRGYKKSNMAFDRVKPFTNFFSVRTEDGICRGWGAWEVVARYSYIDLDDPDANPFLNANQAVTGELNSFGFGVNWYLNSHSRVMFNWVYNDVDRAFIGTGINVTQSEVSASNNASGIRFQIDW